MYAITGVTGQVGGADAHAAVAVLKEALMKARPERVAALSSLVR
ncbi:hypothetical protein [Paraburkholderia elongata]|nr:hypothetical protein [Paraburkholderia elongata]